MGIRATVSGGAYGRYQRTINEAFEDAEKDTEFVMETIMSDAATEARHNVADRGVHNTVPNQEGRGTGKMENAIDSRVFRRGDVIYGQFGWLPGSVRPKWYGFNESGTRLHGQPEGDPDPRRVGADPDQEFANRGIRPMFALHDAGQHAAEELRTKFARH